MRTSALGRVLACRTRQCAIKRLVCASANSLPKCAIATWDALQKKYRCMVEYFKKVQLRSFIFVCSRVGSDPMLWEDTRTRERNFVASSLRGVCLLLSHQLTRVMNALRIWWSFPLNGKRQIKLGENRPFQLCKNYGVFYLNFVSICKLEVPWCSNAKKLY